MKLDGWIPIRLYSEGGRLMTEWCCLRDLVFADPFFDMTIARACTHPFRAAFCYQTSADVLEERAVSRAGIPPAGLVLHASRCGSTLISQMLASSPANVVISEAAPVDSAIYAERLAPGISDERRISLLRAVVHALGQPRGGGERRYFLKLDCWHTLDLELIRRAFPETPWIFVYRDPVEILASLGAAPAKWIVPSLVSIHDLRFSPADYRGNSTEYAARVLARIFESALEWSTRGGMLVNYRQLPGAMFSEVAAHFGCSWDADETKSMMAATAYHAKTPQLYFEPDTTQKQREASPKIHDLCERYLNGLYRDLLRQT